MILLHPGSARQRGHRREARSGPLAPSSTPQILLAQQNPPRLAGGHPRPPHDGRTVTLRRTPQDRQHDQARQACLQPRLQAASVGNRAPTYRGEASGGALPLGATTTAAVLIARCASSFQEMGAPSKVLSL